MRWKLLFVAPLLAAAAAAGAVFALGRLVVFNHGSPLTLGYILVPPFVTAVGAAVYVYRHTARRRALQAVVSGLLSLALFCAAQLALDSFAH